MNFLVHISDYSAIETKPKIILLVLVIIALLYREVLTP